MPFQEAECAAEGGNCEDSCGCEVDVLHGFCPNQPNAIKCCPCEELKIIKEGLLSHNQKKSIIWQQCQPGSKINNLAAVPATVASWSEVAW